MNVRIKNKTYSLDIPGIVQLLGITAFFFGVGKSIPWLATTGGIIMGGSIIWMLWGCRG